MNLRGPHMEDCDSDSNSTVSFSSELIPAAPRFSVFLILMLCNKHSSSLWSCRYLHIWTTTVLFLFFENNILYRFCVYILCLCATKSLLIIPFKFEQPRTSLYSWLFKWGTYVFCYDFLDQVFFLVIFHSYLWSPVICVFFLIVFILLNLFRIVIKVCSLHMSRFDFYYWDLCFTCSYVLDYVWKSLKEGFWSGHVDDLSAQIFIFFLWGILYF